MTRDSPLDDNPPNLNERDEVVDFLREEFPEADPMDISKDGQLNAPRISEGNAVLHAFADEPAANRAGRSDTAVMLEWERVVDAGLEAGIDIESRPPVDGPLPEYLEDE